MNQLYKSVIRPFLFRIDAEKVHHLLFGGLQIYKHIPPLRGYVKHESKCKKSLVLKNMSLLGRVGLAAGFDKDAEVFDELADFGFAFIEIGTVTPSPQVGNPKPRIFRLIKDESLISRTGFNNPGVNVVLQRIQKVATRSYRLGANINRDPQSTGVALVEDFKNLFTKLYDAVDYFTINWGSISESEFDAVLECLTEIRSKKATTKRIFIKLPADVQEDTLLNIIIMARKYQIEGFIATGPTMDRSNLICLSKTESDKIGAGGVSGKGIGNKSKNVVRFLGENVKGEFIIVGAGGIMSVQDAKEMINLGADLIQIYSAFIFEGPEIVEEMNHAILMQ